MDRGAAEPPSARARSRPGRRRRHRRDVVARRGSRTRRDRARPVGGDARRCAAQGDGARPRRDVRARARRGAAGRPVRRGDRAPRRVDAAGSRQPRSRAVASCRARRTARALRGVVGGRGAVRRRRRRARSRARTRLGDPGASSRRVPDRAWCEPCPCPARPRRVRSSRPSRAPAGGTCGCTASATSSGRSNAPPDGRSAGCDGVRATRSSPTTGAPRARRPSRRGRPLRRPAGGSRGSGRRPPLVRRPGSIGDEADREDPRDDAVAAVVRCTYGERGPFRRAPRIRRLEGRAPPHRSMARRAPSVRLDHVGHRPHPRRVLVADVPDEPEHGLRVAGRAPAP